MSNKSNDELIDTAKEQPFDFLHEPTEEEKKETNEKFINYCVKNGLWNLVHLELKEGEFGEVFIPNKKEALEVLENIEEIVSMRINKVKAHKQLEDFAISDKKKEAEKRVTNKMRL